MVGYLPWAWHQMEHHYAEEESLLVHLFHLHLWGPLGGGHTVEMGTCGVLKVEQ